MPRAWSCNQTSASRDYLVEVRTSSLGDQCNRYDLATQIVPGFPEVCDDFFDNDGDGNAESAFGPNGPRQTPTRGRRRA